MENNQGVFELMEEGQQKTAQNMPKCLFLLFGRDRQAGISLN